MQAKEQKEFEERMQKYPQELKERAKKKSIPDYWIEKAPERLSEEPEPTIAEKTPSIWRKIKKLFKR